MVSSVGMFSATSPAASGQWKPVTGGAGATAASWGATGVRQDSVSVSKLGRALTGMAAEVFSYLDDKTRSTLESIVEQGTLSADEVVDGLKAYGKDALFSRYLQERTPTAAEVESQKKQADDMASLQAYMNGLGSVRKEQTDRRTAAQAQYDAGAISWEEMSAQWRDADAAAQEKRAVLESQRPESNGATSIALSPAFGEFAELDFGDGDQASNVVNSLASSGARGKLLEKIIPQMKNFHDALKRFAENYTMPQPGVPAAAATAQTDATAGAAQTNATAGAAQTSAPAATTNAYAASGKSTGASTTANGQAAISLLQAAAGGGKPASGAAGADASLESLLKALKAGNGTKV